MSGVFLCKGERVLPKAKKQAKKKSEKNPTRQRLEGTPFSTANELNLSQGQILKEEWEQLERARVRKELLQREEYSYIIKRFQKGLSCKFENGYNDLFRIYIDEEGATQVALDKKYKTQENSEALIGLIKSLSEAFEVNYLKAMKVLPVEELASWPKNFHVGPEKTK